MSLQVVLSSLRHIILDEAKLPKELEKRREYYREKFPKLTNEELEDLSLMDPKRIRLYTTSIYASQRNLLRRKLPLTFAVLDKFYAEYYGEDFKPYLHVKAMHQKYPWKEGGTENLVGNFLNYLKSDLDKFYERIESFKDIVSIDYASFGLFRLREEGLGKDDALSLDALSPMTVSEVMELEFYLPSITQFRKFDFEVIPFRRYFRKNRSLREKFPKERINFAIGGRNSSFDVTWQNLSLELYDYLSSQPRDTMIPLSLFAEAFIEQSDSSLSEEEIFHNFIELVIKLYNSGAVFLSAPK
ncbi:MAG: hypothetical protein H6619_04105 [Deltaproteobacteria bacterium]|nr:hypothetical protein [Deltaproteobacteria bacterium]